MILVAAISLSACMTDRVDPVSESDAAAARLIDSAEELTREVEAQMSPEERQAVAREIDRRVKAHMDARAAACGTSIRITNEPEVKDRQVWIERNATLEQIECFRKAYPFARVAAE
jgi:hypothetical protein